VQAEEARDPREADRLNGEAVKLMDSDPAEAEMLLRQALSADLYHGPAHNNLGVLYLEQGQLYQAANEFEWARKLMPGHPDPRLNLALTLERAGRVDEALDAYAAALEVYPGHVGALQGQTRLQLREGRADAGTDEALREIALRGEDERWREWARGRLR
jgi:tetratricopeptide (TPR) repeat protein